MIILPLVALEDQFGAEMEKLGIRFLSLTNTPVENMEEQILDQNPRVLLTNVESLNNSAVQRKISKLKLSYIAIDEAQFNLHVWQYKQTNKHTCLTYNVDVIGGSP